MRCTRCQTPLLPGKRFCHACGAPVAQTCGQCGAQLEAGFRYCPDCGAPTSAPSAPRAADDAPRPAPEPGPPAGRLERLAHHVPEPLAEKIRASAGAASSGERKRVTVLFCDLAGSTAIADRLDPEEYRDLLDAYLEIALREIYRLEGVVNQLAGDGLMALFGAPIAHEDAPERAVRAALALRDALAQLNRAELSGRNLELRPRIGINTGPVVVGAVGNDLKMDYTAIGDTTNVAARLEALAAPGTILISEATERLLRGRFDLRRHDGLAVKGKAEPITAFEVCGARDAGAAAAPAALRDLTPLVARDAELAQLEACFGLLAARLPQMVSIVGDAGSGKSRLLFEFRQRLGATAIVLEGRCASLTQAASYAPWVGLLRRHFDIAPDDSIDAAAAKVAAAWPDALDEDDMELLLSSMFRREARRAGAAPGGARRASWDEADGPERDSILPELKRRTFELCDRLIAHLAERAPVLLVFEDLHWIDEASREMLELAAASLCAERVMVLVSHRPEFEPRWRASGAHTQLHLRPLADAAATALIRAVIGGALPAELEAQIRARAEGNPLLIEEIARSLGEEGYIRVAGGSAELTRPVDEIRIPETVQEVIGARLDRLGSQGKRVAQVAAVLGRQFRRDHLEQLLAAEGIDVPARLAELEQRGVVHRKTMLTADEYRFGESATQEIAYESLLVRERRRLHERIARLLEDDGGDGTAESSAVLAHHYARSDDRARAIEALLRAGRDAERTPSYGTALGLYRRAWETASRALEAGADAGVQRGALAAALGVARLVVQYGSADDVPDLLEVAQRGHEIADRVGDAADRAAIRAYEGTILASLGRAEFERGTHLIGEAESIAAAAGHDRLALGMRRALAWAYLFDARFDLAAEVIAQVERELAAGDRGGPPSDLHLGALHMRDTVLLQSDRTAEAVEAARRTHELALQVRNRTVEAASASVLAQALFARGDAAEALRWAESGLKTAEQIGSIGSVRPASAVILSARRELGLPVSPAAFLTRIEQGLAVSGTAPLGLRILLEALLDLGEVRRAERCAELTGRHRGGALREMANAVGRGHVALRLGPHRLADAERDFARAIELAQASGVGSTLGLALAGRAEIARRRGEIESARRDAERARAGFARLEMHHYARRVDGLLAAIERGAPSRLVPA